ncbi:MAG: PQQ-binding-like beta-propeller repeat protein [Acidobacteriota bacterium]|nr:PQQ-binding-like beta-propeller repeat protein [Acidobacteriota bacterium]
MRLTIRLVGQSVVLLFVFSVSRSPAATEPAGAAIYRTHCAQCHDAEGLSRVPHRSALVQLSPAFIRNALDSGVMKQQGSALTAQERSEVASWLSVAGTPSGLEISKSNSCPAGKVMPPNSGPGWTNWGAGLANERYQPDSGLTVETIPHLKLRWAFGVADAKVMRSQPVAYQGRVYLGTDSGLVVSVDAKTGCTYWSTQLKNVRSGLTIGKAGSTEALFFGDVNGVAHALNLATGKELWQTKVTDHPVGFITGTPAYANGRLYVPLSSYEEAVVLAPNYRCCTFRGSLSSLDSATGKLIWQSHTIEEQAAPRGQTNAGADVFGPSGAPIWSSPTLDPVHHAIYVTTGDNYSDPATKTSDAVLALDIETGKQLWSKQFTGGDVYNFACGKPGVGACKNGIGPDFDFGSSPVLVTMASGKRCLLLGQKSGMIYAIDPDDKGAVLWQQRVGRGGALGGVQWGPATDTNLFYVAVSDVVFKKGKDPRELTLDGAIGGGLSAYSVSSGKLVWKAAPPVCGDRDHCSPAQSAAVSAITGAVFSGSLDGHIRAYSSASGAVLWDFDTERSFNTVNHVPGEGGSLDVAGPVVAGGMIFVNSGYSQYGGKAGNVLLAFDSE